MTPAELQELVVGHRWGPRARIQASLLELQPDLRAIGRTGAGV